MLRSVVQSSSSLTCMRMLAPSLSRCMGVDGVKSFKERENALENMYFSKEDEKLLRNLLKKMKGQADVHDKNAEMHNEEEEKRLKSIVSKYKMSPQDLEVNKFDTPSGAETGVLSRMMY